MTNNYNDIKKKGFKNININFLTILFLTHGVLYFLTPEEIYNLDNPIKLIKYFVLAIILIAIFNESSFNKILIYLLIIITMISINIISVGQNFNMINVIVYIIPMSILFFYDGLVKNLNIKNIIYFVYILSTIFGYYEYFYLRGVFFRFASSGYRVVSIFINPNNFGLMMTIMSIYILNIEKNKLKSFLLFINSLLLILLSGSKTALILFNLIICIKLVYKLSKVYIRKISFKRSTLLYIPLFGFLVITLVLIYIYIGNNQFNGLTIQRRSVDTMFISLNLRFKQYFRFLDQQYIVFPWRRNIEYVDNIYIHIWGMFGLPVALLYVFFNIYLIYRSINKGTYIYINILLVFLIGGLSTNFLYIWPLSHIYWYLVGSILSKNNKLKMS